MHHPKPLETTAPRNHVTGYVERLVQSGAPIVLSINGQVELHLTHPFGREKFLELLDRLEYIEGVQDAIDSMDRGEGISLEDFMRSMSEKHGIPG